MPLKKKIAPQHGDLAEKSGLACPRCQAQRRTLAHGPIRLATQRADSRQGMSTAHAGDNSWQQAREIRSGPPEVPGTATNPGTRTNQARETSLGDVGLTALLPVRLVLNGCESEALGCEGGAGIRNHAACACIGGVASVDRHSLLAPSALSRDAWPIRARSAGSCTFKPPLLQARPLATV